MPNLRIQNALTIDYVFSSAHNVHYQTNYVKLHQFIGNPTAYLKISRELQKLLPLSLCDRIVVAFYNLFGFQKAAAEKIAQIVKLHFDPMKFPPDLTCYEKDPDCSFVSFHPKGRPISVPAEESPFEVIKKIAEQYEAERFYYNGEPVDILHLDRRVRKHPIPALED